MSAESEMRPGDLARGVIATGFENARLGELPSFGGYLLFARNGVRAGDVRAVTDALRERHPGVPPPLIAIDQEGGRVARLRDGVEQMPPMMALGATGDLELAARAGEQTAFDLRRAGCTFDLAPSLDLALDPANTVIGNRSLGSDPATVAALGTQFARGLERGGTLACYKHFPGHGSTEVDSHVARPVVDLDAQTLRARDLAPFARVAREARAIMGAHVVVRALDDQLPATLSPRVIAMLRDELAFTGAYVTDCLEMEAVSSDAGRVEAAVQAVRAGADLLLFSHRPDLAAEAAKGIERAVEDGTVALARLREAYQRVMQLRRAAAAPLRLALSAPHPGVGREIARRAMTLVRGLPHADPTASFAVEFDRPLQRLSQEAPVVEDVLLALDPLEGDVEAAIGTIARSGRRPVVLSRRAHLHPLQEAAIGRIVDRFPDAVVVSTLEPFDIGCFDNARHVIAAYGDDVASIGGLADVLFGGMMPQGRLPVELGNSIAPA